MAREIRLNSELGGTCERASRYGMITTSPERKHRTRKLFSARLYPLGHINMSATVIYAECNQGLVDEAALKFGQQLC